jgi:hypothetical protein
MGDGTENIPVGELSPSASRAIISGAGGLY